MNTIDIKVKIKELIDRYEEQKNEVSKSMSDYQIKTVSAIAENGEDDDTYWVDFGTYNTLDCVLTALRKLYKEV